MLKDEFREIFRLHLGRSPPAKVPSMKIKIREGAVPVKVKPRRYPPDQRDFLNSHINELVSIGILRPNRKAKWQCAPLIVPKPDSKAKFRLTIDLRPVNSATIKESWPMPNLDSEMLDFAGSTCFAAIDFVASYWQMPIHPDSENLCGIVTPNGVYSSSRVLHGLTNAVSHFQSSIEHFSSH